MTLPENVFEPASVPYSNLYPNDLWRPKPRFRLARAGDRWKTVATNGSARTARGLFLYIVEADEIWVVKYINTVIPNLGVGHIDLARGDEVDYAGEIRFRSGYNQRGMIIAWNNRSGHYFPKPEDRWVVPLLPQSSFEAHLHDL